MTYADILMDSVFAKASGSFVSDMDGEKVMMSIHSGKYYNLGQVGGRIWELLDDRASVKEIVNKLIAEYQVDPELCERHVRTFLQQLYDEKLIEHADAKAAAGRGE